jgi:exonuclease SbcC
MKILFLKIKNINALEGIHEIDFENGPLAEAGLFGIIGPTGSGKSTLLDAISIALYNRIPRFSEALSENNIAQTGLVLHSNSKDAFVEIHFSSSNQKYRAYWSIAKNKNGNLNKIKPELSELESGTILAHKKSEVYALIESIIGLNYNQFVQSMILAQGQFAKFIQSNKHDRARLLEIITGTQIYRTIGRKAYEMNKEWEKKIVEIQIHSQGISPLSPSELEEKEKEFQQFEMECQRLDHEIQRCRQLIQSYKELESDKSDLDKKIETSNAHLLEKDRILALENLINKHEQLSPIMRELNLLEQLEIELKNYNENLREIEISLQEQQRKNEQLVSEILQFLSAEQISNDLEDELRFFENAFHADSRQSALLKSKGEELKIQIKQIIQHLEEFDITIDYSQSKSQAQAFLDEILNTLNQHKLYQFDELSEKIASLSDTHKIELTFLENVKNCNRIEASSQFLLKENQRLRDEIDQYNLDLISLEKESKDLELWIAAHQQKLDFQKISQSLDSHRNELKDNEPCPLCGATDHPYKIESLRIENDLQNRITEQQINLNKILQSKNQKIGASNSNEKGIGINLEKLNDYNKEKNEFIGNNQKISSTHPYLSSKSLSEINQDIQNKEEEIQNLNKLYTQLSAKPLLEQLIQVSNEIHLARIEFTALQDQMTLKYKKEDIPLKVETYFDQLQKIKLNINQLETKLELTLTTIQKKSKQENQIVTEVNLFLSQFNSNYPSCKTNLLSSEQYVLSKDQIKEFNDKKIVLETEIDQLIQQIQKRQSEIESIDPAQTQELLKELQETKMNKEQIKLDAYALISQTKSDIQELLLLEQKKEAYLEKQRPWKILSNMIGDASGNNFSQLVQEITFEYLIYFANIRLSKITDRYRLIAPKSQEEYIFIEDTYFGNTLRSVASLSGGETFKISLCLALGLSDLASRDVKIDSLFIDEGFGTLDPEALEESISLLEQLQNETGKSIGIISHVTELKDRLTTKIRLVTQQNGTSTISIEQN